MDNSDIKCYTCIHGGHHVADTGVDPKVCEECYDIADDDGFVFHRNYEPDIKEYIVCGVGEDEHKKLERIGIELIRCKNCKHYEPNRLFTCSKHGSCHATPDFFCADAEERED